MTFNRHLLAEMVSWKDRKNRKTLILRGARQVGKTTLVKSFAKQYYKNYIFLNLEKEEEKILFEQGTDINMVVNTIFLSKNTNTDLLPKTLLFIDEIQESPKAIQLLRYFYEEVPNLHVIAAGSLLEFALKDVKSFPVGRVTYLYLHPFSFQEYLEAMELDQLTEQLHQIPINKVAHNILLKRFNEYTIIGGMPEIISTFKETQSVAALSIVYESIWETYRDDLEKYAKNDTERKVLKHLINTAAFHIDQRIKFQHFGNSNYKSREVSEAFYNLDLAKVIRLIYPTTGLTPPIMPDIKKSPRLQFLDTGLLNHILEIQAQLLPLNDLSNGFKGAIIPHIMTQELIALKHIRKSKPMFWVREKAQSSAEVDLLFPFRDKIIPIEIKSGKTGKLKSLHQFVQRANHPYAVRIYGGAFEIHEAKTPSGTAYLLMNLPYYLISKIEEYLQFFTQNHSLES